MEGVLQDLRFAFRVLVKTPAFALAAVSTLALGIGAGTAIFSVANAAFLRPLPYRDTAQLVWPSEFYPNFNRSVVFAPEYAAWKRQSTAFQSLEAFGITIGVNLTRGGQPAQRVQAGHVTPGLFALLGVQPQIGRSFRADEDTPGRDRVAVLSDSLWRDYFQADPSILGRTVILDGAPRTVIGVMPSGFLYPGGLDAAVWLPDAVAPASTVPRRGMSVVAVIGRLKSGVTPAQAQADLAVVARRMDGQYPPPWSGYHAAATVRVVALRQHLTGDARTALFILLGAVGFILLIVCANVANLFLARAVAREKEMAVRAAVGASRGRIVRLLLIESLLFGALGGIAGLILARSAASRLEFLMPRALPASIALDWRVFGFAALCSVAASLLFGLAPAFTATRLDLHTSLKAGRALAAHAARGLTLRGALAVAQLALSLILLIGAGLLMRSFLAVLNVPPGFDPHNVLLADISLAPLDVYTAPRQVAYFDRLLAAVAALPGVQHAGLSSATPLVPFNAVASGLRPEGGPESDAVVCLTSAGGDYFQALRIPLTEGRYFKGSDNADAAPVAIVNQTLARLLFPDRHPLGRRILLDERRNSWATVVGVVADMRHRSLDGKTWPELFQPYRQAPSYWMSLVVRGAGDPESLIPAVQKAAQSADRNQPLFNIGSLEQRVSSSLAPRRSRAFLLGAFALIALLIAIVGVYGVMAYSVTRRTQEIGIRMALGAGRRDVLRMVVSEGLRLALAGTAIGLGGAFALTRLLETFLYNVTPTDPATFASVCTALIATAALAAYLPARRATKVDPMSALRQE